MAIKCLNCNAIVKGNSLPKYCPVCGNKDLTKYIRVESEFTLKEQKQHDKDKAFLESRKI
jgi:Zn finger protein HypA/HybF involved in hydrogenase expression